MNLASAVLLQRVVPDPQHPDSNTEHKISDKQQKNIGNHITKKGKNKWSLNMIYTKRKN